MSPKNGNQKGCRPQDKATVQKMLLHCDSSKEKALLRFMHDTGMRSKDVTLAIFKAKNDELGLDLDNAYYSYYSSKTNVYVKVPLTANTISSLNSYISIHKIKAGERLFPISTRRIRQIYKTIKKRAGITEKFSPHDMCATAIHNLINAGAPDRVISDITGRTIKTIKIHYDKHTLGELREWQEKANKLD
jgi:site-specific recombinase XerD